MSLHETGGNQCLTHQICSTGTPCSTPERGGPLRLWARRRRGAGAGRCWHPIRDRARCEFSHCSTRLCRHSRYPSRPRIFRHYRHRASAAYQYTCCRELGAISEVGRHPRHHDGCRDTWTNQPAPARRWTLACDPGSSYPTRYRTSTEGGYGHD